MKYGLTFAFRNMSYRRYIKPMLQILQDKESSSQHFAISRKPYYTSNRHWPPFPNVRERNRHILNPTDGSLILLVDFKADPDLSAKLLGRALQPLLPYLSKVENRRFQKGRVTVIISGNRPKRHCLFARVEEEQLEQLQRPLFRGGSSMEQEPCSIMREPSLLQRARRNLMSDWMRNRAPGGVDDATRYLFLDGRIRDLNNQEDSSLVPLVSIDWNIIRLRNWFRGKGDDEVMKQMTDRAHSQGKRIRIWGAPNTEKCWTRMLKSNVDWLGIDDHERFSRFVNRNSELGSENRKSQGKRLLFSSCNDKCRNRP